MFGNIDPTKYMGETTDMLEGRNFGCYKPFLFQAKTYAVDRASNLELLMLVLDFKVDYRLKNTQWYF